ncbi:hypothetical protein V8J88_11685 [Massilia sp. W12]|uniref:hypothetical protein n=1 Tax=Massilia sp. W12 TaxID=3126507 RepID=UPI0030CFF256
MPSDNVDSISGRFSETWKERPEAALGVPFLNYIKDNISNSFLPFSEFVFIAKKNNIEDVNVVMNVLNFFSGDWIKLLCIGYEYIDPDGDVVFELDEQQVHDVFHGKINPITHSFDESIYSKIFVYYYPSKHAKNIFREGV